jgi:hypothetical protein
MDTNVAFTLTNTSVTVVWQGKPYIFQKGTPNFTVIRNAILAEEWNKIPQLLTVDSSLAEWAKGEFSVQGDQLFYKGDEIPKDLNARILRMASAGDNPSRFFKFCERLLMNPSARSVNCTPGFLEHEGIPLDEEGFIMAYKSVRMDFKDHYTGTVDNSPGAEPEMPRNKISDDPREACHYGYHVGALTYAKDFHAGDDQRIVIVRVDPKDVVCVPYDCSQKKMRVCKYKVVGLYTGAMDDTCFRDENAPDDNVDDEPDCDPDASDIPDDDDETEDDFNQPPVKGKPAKKAKAEPVLVEVLDAMDGEALMEVPLDQLRKYAAGHLKMVGASKLPGGKVILVKNILEARVK